MSAVNAVCENYGVRPSEIFKISDDVLALDFDCAVICQAYRIREGESKTDRQKKQEFSNSFDKLKFAKERADLIRGRKFHG